MISATALLASEIARIRASGRNPTRAIVPSALWEQISAELTSLGTHPHMHSSRDKRFMDVPVELTDDSGAIAFDLAPAEIIAARDGVGTNQIFAGS
ncbi:MAG: hypothetical protein EON59_18185 [Alphaproteobacteria bacterium]|nr:MAG: hypothetical protein EON59_18185 [Alphaproteobacteria bacterium]